SSRFSGLKPCNGGYADGCGYLATMYGLGDGVKMNQATAKKYYGKACELGHKESCATYQKMTQMGVK
ncbi:MAG: sel1 repeat family protein, partial [Neisseriaceae bacterium]|nr:sel1 repeat family protein [Neisseriaceae bacterium]